MPISNTCIMVMVNRSHHPKRSHTHAHCPNTVTPAYMRHCVWSQTPHLLNDEMCRQRMLFSRDCHVRGWLSVWRNHIQNSHLIQKTMKQWYYLLTDFQLELRGCMDMHAHTAKHNRHTLRGSMHTHALICKHVRWIVHFIPHCRIEHNQGFI